MFTPRYVKHSKLLLRHAEKYLRYKKDILNERDRGEITSGIAALSAALPGNPGPVYHQMA